MEDNEWMNWSKVMVDDDKIKMICEKERVVSKDYDVRGIIGCILFNDIHNKFKDKKLKYVSDCLDDLLHNNKILKTIDIEEANFYGDETMLETYVNIRRKQCSIFCDIDGVFIKHSPHSTSNIEDNVSIKGISMVLRMSGWNWSGNRCGTGI